MAKKTNDSDNTKEKEKEISFEQSIAELEQVVAKLEKGDLPLEESMSLFNKGINLTAFCSKKLNEAEKEITILIEKKDGGYEEKPLE